MHPENIEGKIEGHRRFWDREEVERPLLGFDTGGFFPLRRFMAFGAIADGRFLEPEQVRPSDFLDEHRRLYREASAIEDDLIRGVSPLPALPWMEAMLGCRVMVTSDSLWAEERKAKWEELRTFDLTQNRWFDLYLEYLRKLSSFCGGRIPVGQPIIRGITDLMGALRGHNQILIDGLKRPAEVRVLADIVARAEIEVFERQYSLIKPFYEGYVLEQFALWAPGRVIRIQEDATAVYSPAMYRELVQEKDRLLASSFPLTVFHLHSSSLFLLEALLEIEEIDVFQIGRDVGGLNIGEMLPQLKRIQGEGRGLILRGPLAGRELAAIRTELDPRGLMVQIVLDDPADRDEYRAMLRRLWGPSAGR